MREIILERLYELFLKTSTQSEKDINLISNLLTSLNLISEDIEQNSSIALAGGGTEYIFGTGAVINKAYKYLVVNADATFTVLLDSADIDLTVDLGIGANAVTKGMIIRAKAGKTIKNITLATGSVVGIL